MNPVNDTISKLIKAIIYLSLIIFILLGLLISIYWNNPEISVAGEPEVFYCGVAYEDQRHDLAGKRHPDGEKIFKTNCTSCHKWDKKLVGPALQGASMRLKHNLAVYITNEQALIDQQDSYTLAINALYQIKADHNFELSEEEVDALIAYLAF